MFDKLYNKIAEKTATSMYAKFTAEKKAEERSVVKDIVRNPDNFILTAYVEGDELKVSLKRKPIKEGTNV